MPDPGLVSRAQRAATMLERAWDRWRAAHGLAAEPLPPVSSYVGYSIEEPWGRPRVVFGVDAADAEKLATLLQDCAAPPQQAMDEARPRIPAQGRTADLNGTREHSSATLEHSGVTAGHGTATLEHSGVTAGHGTATLEHSGATVGHGTATLEHGGATLGHGGAALGDSGAALGDSGTERSAGSAKATHPVEAEAPPADQADADGVQEGGTTDLAVHSDAGEDGAGESAAPDGTAADASEGSPENPDLPVGQEGAVGQEGPVGQEGAVGQDGPATPDSSGSDQQEPPAAADGQDPGKPAARKMQGASDAGDARNAGRGVTDTMVAELAGWAAGELPGQASARLAAWAAVGGTSARSGADADLRTSSGAAEPIS